MNKSYPYYSPTPSPKSSFIALTINLCLESLLKVRFNSAYIISVINSPDSLYCFRDQFGSLVYDVHSREIQFQ